MITNEAVRQLITLDQDTLVDLMALAYADGVHQYYSSGGSDTWSDPDIRALIVAARGRVGRHTTDRAAVVRWNAEMSAL